MRAYVKLAIQASKFQLQIYVNHLSFSLNYISTVIAMKNYCHFQTNQLKNLTPDSIFTVDATALDHIKTWGITNIYFPQHDPKGRTDRVTLFTFSAVSFGSNEEQYDLQASILKNGKEIHLQFASSQTNVPVSTFTNLQGNREWRPVEQTVISHLNGKFKGRHYKEGELDIFALIETIGDKEEMPILKQQRKLNGSSSNTFLKILRGIAIVAIIGGIIVALSSPKVETPNPIQK